MRSNAAPLFIRLPTTPEGKFFFYFFNFFEWGIQLVIETFLSYIVQQANDQRLKPTVLCARIIFDGGGQD